MKHIIVAIFSILILQSDNVTKTNLTVKIEGFEKEESSEVVVAIFKEKNFLETPISFQYVKINNDKVIANFELEPGEYAVSTFQDLNGNRKLDKKFYGPPKEPYGFSNNVRPFGKPSFKKCKFNLTSDSKTITIALIN
ncbi:MAG: hypothetical protein Wins2KO_14780 [Winogradskyella sp.]|uniref:DUF2141 domain-containing protein n=1 Tax=Winogradskyella sp. TaxID=1883156 RepID=UPI0025F105B5|nr:DUF2141 domain-containing protein [Winogradskyella sp.]NRB58793.1 DUF2141 domain-containing protein [Winogradskyella sp.]